METAELKRLLSTSKKEPVSCAVGLSKDGTAQMLLHKTKTGRALLGEMEKTEGKITGPAFGTAAVDAELDPKLVVLTLNRAPSGVGRKLKKALKGTGYSKVEIRLEDGTVAESVGEEDEEAAPQAAPTAATAPAEPPPAAPPTPPLPDPAIAALTAALPALVKQVQTAIAADTSRAAALKGLTAAAVTAVKGQDVAAATAAMTALKDELAAVAAPAPASGPDFDIKALQASFATLVQQVIAVPRDEAERIATLRAKAAEIGAALKAADGATATDAIAELRTMLATPAAPAAKTGPAPIEIWRDAKEAVDGGITALQKACKTRSVPPAVAQMLQDVADKGLNGVTNRASVGMMAAMMQAETSPAGKASALKAVDTFQAFLDSPMAGLIDDNPLGVPIGLRRTFGTALQTIKARLAA